MPRPSRARGGFPQGKAAAIWVLIFAALTGGYGVLGPAVDDARSDLRTMRSDCTVRAVTDGDTLELRCPDLGAFPARIVGYDSPELFSPACAAEAEAAEAARRALAALIRDAGALEVALLGRDRYDRRLVDLRADGERVTARMVADGHGRRYLGGLRGGWCA
jgi:endonuclease YncB( thermonuclease family)